MVKALGATVGREGDCGGDSSRFGDACRRRGESWGLGIRVISGRHVAPDEFWPGDPTEGVRVPGEMEMSRALLK